MGERAPRRRERPAPVPPPEIEELVACLGPELAMTLVELRGGTRLHVPGLAGMKRSFLLDVLGEEPLRRLAQVMGNAVIRVPIVREWRARMYLHAGGRSHSEIARLVGGTEKWVQTLCHTDWTPMPRSHKALRRTPASDMRQMSLSAELSSGE
jgi:hypothetical protein